MTRILAQPNFDTPTIIMVNASDLAVSIILEYHHNVIWTTISFYSRKLHKLETWYSAFYRVSMPFILPFAIFDIFVGRLPVSCLFQTQPLILSLLVVQIGWRHAMFVLCPTSLSILLTSDTFRARTQCGGQCFLSSLIEQNFTSWLWDNGRCQKNE